MLLGVWFSVLKWFMVKLCIRIQFSFIVGLLVKLWKVRCGLLILLVSLCVLLSVVVNVLQVLLLGLLLKLLVIIIGMFLGSDVSCEMISFVLSIWCGLFLLWQGRWVLNRQKCWLLVCCWNSVQVIMCGNRLFQVMLFGIFGVLDSQKLLDFSIFRCVVLYSMFMCLLLLLLWWFLLNSVQFGRCVIRYLFCFCISFCVLIILGFCLWISVIIVL